MNIKKENRKQKNEHIWKQKCLVCSKKFKSKRSDAKYCSNACRQRAYRNNKQD